MKTKAILLGMVLALPLVGQASSLDAYLKIREQMGITQASGPAALDTFVGSKVLEVAGVVKGYLRSDGVDLLILENPEGRELYVSSRATPDWLKTGNTPSRLIIRATRTAENARLMTELLSACSEGLVVAHERAELKKAEERIQAERKAAAAEAAKKANRGTTTSRSGGRPPRLPGDIPKLSANMARTTPNLSADLLAMLPNYTAFILNRNKKLAPAEAEHIAMTLLAYSAKYGVDPRLVTALVLCESGFDPGATSHAGAQGLGQLMPGTARGLGVGNSYDTEQNLAGTVKLLRGHLDKYNNQTGDDFEALVLALAAYNAGGGAVRRHGGVPPYKETQNYVRKVIATYKQLIGE